MVATDSFLEGDISVTNGSIVTGSWLPLDARKYQIEVEAIQQGVVTVTIDRSAYKQRYGDDDNDNEAAMVSWKYNPDYKAKTIIKPIGDIKTIKDAGHTSNQTKVTLNIDIDEYKERWPINKWQSLYLIATVLTEDQETEIHKKYIPDGSYEITINEKACAESCTVKVTVNSPDGHLIESIEWKYTPTPKGNEQQEPIDNQLGPAPELILRDEAANNQRERVLEIKGIEFTIGRNTPHFHPDIQIYGGRLIHFKQIQPQAYAATIEANEPGTVTAIIFENIGGQNNKSASKNWTYQPDDNNQNNKIVTPKITVKDGTGKRIEDDTTNRSRVTVEIDTIVDTTDFRTISFADRRRNNRIF
jgi:hypothetical protein